MRVKIKELGKEVIGREINIRGWVRTVRNQKTFTFIEINDGSVLANFQVILANDITDYQKIIASITAGASVSVTGEVVESPAAGQEMEMRAKSVEVLGTCDPQSYPLQKKRHSLEFLRTIAHLRSRTNTLGAVARVRSQLAFATHKFFQEKGFIYLQSPIITASDCEGAGELFKVTTLNLSEVSKREDGAVNFKEDFFEKPAYLTVSGQLNAEIFACSHSDVYTFGPTFRAENSNTSRHLAEFWMVEPEMAFADLDDAAANAEAYVKYLLSHILNNNKEDLEFFDKFISRGLIERLRAVVETPFERVSYALAIRILEKAGKPFEYPVKWGLDLRGEHERFLTEEYFCKPVTLVDYPKEIKPFYMRLNDDDKTVANMDILVPRVGEIIGGSQREERLDLLTKRMNELGLSRDNYWWYLELRKYGSVPHSGYGLGFERLVQFATGIENIRDASAFPRFPGKAEF